MYLRVMYIRMYTRAIPKYTYATDEVHKMKETPLRAKQSEELLRYEGLLSRSDEVRTLGGQKLSVRKY